MITDTLRTLLADHVESTLIVQGYHWNIEGVDFDQYHGLFGSIYSDYSDQIDRLAEYIRIVSSASEYVNASVDVVKLNKTVKSNPVVGSKPIEMVKEIITINGILSKQFKTLFDEATKEGKDGLANYCAERLDYCDKLNWKLTASTK